MTVEKNPATSAAMDGVPFEPGRNGGNGLRKIRINRKFNIRRAADGADCWIVGGLQVSDGL